MRLRFALIGALLLTGCGTSATASTRIQKHVEPKHRIIYDLPSSSSSTSLRSSVSSSSSVTSVKEDHSSRSSSSVSLVRNTPVYVAQAATLLPESVFLSVPFSSQAPFQNWDQPYQDACEEMSFLMIKYFLEGRTFTPEQADSEILQMTNWVERMGYERSISLQELTEVINAYAPEYTATMHSNVSVESIQELLAQGTPVIVPTAGKILNNPYFSYGGPYYHMLVITGYDQEYFYTNDPGTGMGEGYAYTHEVLLNAIHDWEGSEARILEGPKRMLTVQGTSVQVVRNDTNTGL